MKIKRIKLENWKGVQSREIQLDDGVTIIEGPNEIGKTTFVEALRMLVRTMDSSKSRNVKEVQPVGEDVGSRVEAEIEAGGYQITYAKRFNRNTETTLYIKSPKTEHFIGREAHEKALAILEETMDLSLWDALLVDQKKEVSQAKLKDSTGLSKSLDEAAGSSSSGFEESGLINAVKEEFLKYFTPTGQPRNREAESRFSEATIALEETRQSISSIEQDVESHVRSKKEVRRLKGLIPKLEAKYAEHKKDWEKIRSLKANFEAKVKELDDANELLEATKDAEQRRLDLINEIANTEEIIKKHDEDLQPLQRSAEHLNNDYQSSNEVLKIAKNRKKLIGSAIKLASSDKDFLEDENTWEKEQARFIELNSLDEEKAKTLKIISANKIDDEALENIRSTQSQLAVVSGKRETAATNLRVTAKSSLSFLLNDRDIKLDVEQSEEFVLASKTEINFPGQAEIQIEPPASAVDLDNKFAELTTGYEELLADLDVKDFSDAVKINQSRQSSALELERIKLRESQLLQGSSIAEINQVVSDLESKISSYRESRPAEPALPDNLKTALKNLNSLQDELNDVESTIEDSEQSFSTIKEEFDIANLEVQLALQEKKGLAGALNEKQQKLKSARNSSADENLSKRVKEQNSKVEDIGSNLSILKTELESASPEATETRHLNAKLSLERANNEHQDAEKTLAILADRLDQARADGRYESLETAQREFEESKRESQKVSRQAAAIDLLSKTLNFHRDETRKAYVQPLKDRIESLGEIVFGPGFEIEIDDHWQLVSRTLHGKVIPFGSLSVGAREQLGIIARLAAAQIVAKQGGVPLIIDDALGFSDPSRLESVGAAIAKAGQDCQILLMTCSPGRFTHVGNAKLFKLS